MFKFLTAMSLSGAVCAGSALAAQSVVFRLNLDVNPVSATSFEVIEARGAGAMDIWCAAATYAEDTLRIPGNKRLYIEKARGPAVTASGRKGVVFTTIGEGRDNKTYSVSVKQVGYSLPIHHAKQFCLNYIIEQEDRF